MTLNIKGNHRTFSIDCLGGTDPAPIRELTLQGAFTAANSTAIPPVAATPPTITDLEVDILPSTPIQSRQALSVAVDTSYDNPNLIGVDTDSALFSKYNTQSEVYELVIYTGNQSQVTVIDLTDLPSSFGLNLLSETVYAVRIPDTTEISLLSESQIAALTPEQIEQKTEAKVSLLVEDEGEITVSVVNVAVIENNPVTQTEDELVEYRGITEEFREYDTEKQIFKYLIDASALLD